MTHRVLLPACCALALTQCWTQDRLDLPPPESLDEVVIAEDFFFKATREVRIKIDVSDARLAELGTTSLVVIREDGGVIFRGHVPTSGTLEFGVPLPAHEQMLELEVGKGEDLFSRTILLDDNGRGELEL